MSLSGALSSAISALNAQSSSLAMISDNISNADTTGYKTTSGLFEQLVTASSSSKAYSSGGVSVSGRANITQQGLLAVTTNATDVAIQGSGFFVATNSTSAGGETFYTRNGAFTTDNAGYLENDGYYLEGWRTDATGNVVGNGLEPVNTKVALTNGGATTKTSLAANLPADAASGDTFSSSMTVYDSLGQSHALNVTWTKGATANEWTADFAPATASDGTVTSGTYTIDFNSDGSLNTVSSTNLGITWNNGAAASSIALSFGTTGGGTDGLTQLSSGSTTPSVSNFSANSDGISFGTLSSISVGKNGLVEATYSNGQTVPIYKLAVATFADPNGLVAHSSGMYTSTATSGNATLQASGENGAGTIYGSELESSTTDTTGQFSNMISAQQAYSAASQVISAVNKMYDTLISSMR
ncbi:MULTISPECIES: flagellar hook protein FlgE [unclassified Bradyrhizobium]|uniref:flagellar hook protein FlgE n=1 Tax=unclassified Bradyrhizobium TaxID=2631580 RepID=UPI002916BA20|nr:MULTISPECIES: flagellar hook protein FlgE [unclassified Bradyrhizobium]